MSSSLETANDGRMPTNNFDHLIRRQRWAVGSAAYRHVMSMGLIGSTVSRYRVLDLLGVGGMGVVYRAEDNRLRRLVALKFVSSTLSQDPVALRQFEREARTASSLSL
jgi:serine/threonine protein kinase